MNTIKRQETVSRSIFPFFIPFCLSSYPTNHKTAPNSVLQGHNKHLLKFITSYAIQRYNNQLQAVAFKSQMRQQADVIIHNKK